LALKLILSNNLLLMYVATGTRKLSYRKDDRAMRPTYGALKIFESP